MILLTYTSGVDTEKVLFVISTNVHMSKTEYHINMIEKNI